MAEVDSSISGSVQFQPDHTEIQERLVFWDTLDPGRICRTPDQTVRPLRVLLAEDNPLDQLSIRRLLEKQGVSVFLAGDGRRAVEMYEGGDYDLVLLDILMPEMDGFEVATHIREHEVTSGASVPIIALTAYSLKAVYDKCKSVGMNGYLSKPVASSDLQALCSALLPASTELLPM